MRLAYLLPEWGRYSEYRAVTLLKILKPFCQVIVCMKSNRIDSYFGIPVVELKECRFARLLKGKRVLCRFSDTSEMKLRRILHSYRIDTVFCNYGTFAVGFFDTWQSFSGRMFVQFHGYDAHFYLKDCFGKDMFKEDYKKLLYRLSKETNSIFLANSYYTLKLLLECGIPESKLRVSYLPVEQIEIPEGNTRNVTDIISVGRMVDVKGHDYTIMAFEEVMKHGMDATLTIIGDGVLFQRCEELRNRSIWKDRIILTGALSHDTVVYHLLKSGVFIQHCIQGRITGQCEAFGVSILETMSAGLPVVVGSSGEVTEYVNHMYNGLLFEPGDIKEQADYLVKVISNPDLYSQLSRNAITISRRFSVECLSKDIIRFLMENYG